MTGIESTVKTHFIVHLIVKPTMLDSPLTIYVKKTGKIIN